ncbi:hypothetical protein [Ferrovibrio sp.]
MLRYTGHDESLSYPAAATSMSGVKVRFKEEHISEILEMLMWEKVESNGN